MSHPRPQQQQPPSPSQADRYGALLQNTALVALIACPALALLPPRKLDFYTFSLLGMTGFSANFVVRERTGRSIAQRLGVSSPSAQPAVSEQIQQTSPFVTQQEGAGQGLVAEETQK